MRKMILSSGVAVMAAGLFLAGCGAEQTPETTTQQPAAETAQTVQAYPLDWCIVSGEKLGSMGDPPSITYAGREIKFCCKNCVKAFQASPASYLAKIDSAAASQLPDPDAKPEGGEGEGTTGHEGHDHG